MDEDVSSAEVPLIRPESLDAHDRPENSELREQDLTSPSWFIWALTFSAGISGLLFGYEYSTPPSPPVTARRNLYTEFGMGAM